MPVTNLPPLSRYLDDKQWAVVGRAIKQAGGQINDGNRLHVDAILDLMRTRMPWRDLDHRYGPWAGVHFKYVRWYETGILHGVVQALFSLGLTDKWRPITEISHGPSARSGPAIRPLMVQIAVELRRHRDAKGKKRSAKLSKPESTIYRDKRKQYAKKIKEAVKARKGSAKMVLSDADWGVICSRVPDFDVGPQDNARRQINELLEVMRTNKGWSYMDPKAGKPSAVYARFTKWTAEGLMPRLVKCLAELGLTKDWNQFLVAPLVDGEVSLKMIIGAEAHRYIAKPKKKAAKKKVATKTKAKVRTAVKAKAKVARLQAKRAKASGQTKAKAVATNSAQPASSKRPAKSTAKEVAVEAKGAKAKKAAVTVEREASTSRKPTQSKRSATAKAPTTSKRATSNAGATRRASAKRGSAAATSKANLPVAKAAAARKASKAVTVSA